jgi:Mn2+/Fe2+ NRAMP family transporter
MGDPYTAAADAVREPPATWRARIRHLGPSVVIAGSIVGSGELILTTSLGAAAGFTLLWWLLVCCWSKSIVQAELARYIVTSGDTYLRALNRIPGQLSLGRARVSWTLWLSLLAFIPDTIGMGGIVGGAAQAMGLIVPGFDSRWVTLIAALAASAILYSGSYRRIEHVMLVLVVAFVLATLVSMVAMQFTPYALSARDLASGLEFRLPMEHLVLALAVYGATGVNSAEICTYGYWCIEKGYPRFVGDDRSDPRWPIRARGWTSTVQVDVLATLAILTLATVPFYLLGAGVLHANGERPQGAETISALSSMFTHTLGSWSLWLFAGAAFCILFSSVVAGFGGISRLLPDYLVEFGFLERSDLDGRLKWIRLCGGVLPIIAASFYFAAPNPVTLLTIGALMGAALLPVQSGATLWLQRHYLDARVRPSTPARALLVATFVFQVLMAGLVIWAFVRT